MFFPKIIPEIVERLSKLPLMSKLRTAKSRSTAEYVVSLWFCRCGRMILRAFSASSSPVSLPKLRSLPIAANLNFD